MTKMKEIIRKSKNDFMCMVMSSNDTLVGEYINNTSKVVFICEHGHRYDKTPKDYKTGSRCPICANAVRNRNKIAKSKRDLFDMAKHNGDVIVGEYISNHKPIKFYGSCGHTFSISPAHYKNGHSCSICGGSNQEIAKLKFGLKMNEIGWTCIDEYVNNKTKLNMICNNGHKNRKTPNCIINNKGCAVCSRKSKTQSRKDTYLHAGERNDTIIGEYTNTSTKIEIICSRGHTFHIAPTTYKQGHGCPECSYMNQKTCYINLVIDGEVPIALKFGISTNHKIRMKRQQSKTIFKLKTLGVWDFPTVKQCKLSERTIIETLECSVLNKREMLDGYTETTHVNNIERIIEIFKANGGVRREIIGERNGNS